MNSIDYQNLIKKYDIKENKIKKYFNAFLSGGFIGLFSSIIFNLLIFLNFNGKNSSLIVCLILISISAFLTCIGKFDDLVSKYRCGLIIPTTGFAHSICSCALEYKKDGLITGLGANFFKLAGSVILYSIISSFFLCLLRVVILCLF